MWFELLKRDFMLCFEGEAPASAFATGALTCLPTMIVLPPLRFRWICWRSGTWRELVNSFSSGSFSVSTGPAVLFLLITSSMMLPCFS